MDPNIKLLVEELVKQMHDQKREGFSVHDSIINICFSKFKLIERQREQRITALELAVTSFDRCLSMWKLEVDASLTSVKLELSKLNSFFDWEAKSSTTRKSGVLPIRHCSLQRSTSMAPLGTASKTSTRIVGMGEYSPTPMPRSRVCSYRLLPRSPPHVIIS
jgi:hypothetical protein